MADHRKQIEIRWRDLDVYGHVNNAVYLTYLEEGRDEWLGTTLGDAAEIWNWVLARVAVDYRRELALSDDRITVTCRLERIGTKSVTTREQILKADGTVAAEAEAVLVARDRDSGETRAISDAERVSFEETARAPG
jgi:acyl-CoA thioester hydrolase